MESQAIERNLGCFFIYKKGKRGTKMTRSTDEEKEVLYVYGSPILKDTQKRLGTCYIKEKPHKFELTPY